MTVASETSKVIYNGNGTTTVFSTVFSFINNADVKVVKTTSAGVESNLSITTHYTLSGGSGAVGNVTMLTAPATGEKLTIYRKPPITQTTDYINGDSFDAESHERALDKLTHIVQGVNEEVTRAFKLPVSTTISANLPNPESSKLIGWNDTATALVNYTAGNDSTNLVTSTGTNTARSLANRFSDIVSIKDYGVVGDGMADDTTAFNNAINTAKTVILHEATYKINGTNTVAGAKLIGNGLLNNIIIETNMDVNNEFGLYLQRNSKVENIKIDSNSSGTVTNYRSHCAICFGGQNSQDNAIGKNIEINHVSIQHTRTTDNLGNTFHGIGNVSDIQVNDLYIESNVTNIIQFHWNFNSDRTRTNHPRRIHLQNIYALGLHEDCKGAYFSAAHNVKIENCLFKDVSQGVVIAAGDVGGGYSPQNESIDLIMGGIEISNVTVENCINEAFLIGGKSYILESDEDNPNDRWIATDKHGVGVTLNNCRVLREIQSTNNFGLVIENMRNVVAKAFTLSCKADQQLTSTNEAISIISSNECDIESNTFCVVAGNLISGRKNVLKVNHVNSDTANVSSASGVNIRGAIINAVTGASVANGATSIKISALTCHIHKGMKFEYSGSIFEFDSSAFYSNSSLDNNVILRIKPAPIDIPNGSTIEQYYCAHDTVIKGYIEGAHKGVRLITTDARVPFGIEIDVDFYNSINTDIEVPLGIVIKYKDFYCYNDAGATMTIKGGVFNSTDVIKYQKFGDKKVGYGKASPTTKTWAKGDYIHNTGDTTALTTTAGWVCTVAGTPGTWQAHSF